jgi:AcrR family transcriptional regulator
MADAAATTRDRLLEAARELFTTDGYHATTTPVLAKRAGVAEGTIYRHFPSKQALLNAAYQDVHRWGAEQVRASVTMPGRTGERLMALGQAWLTAAESDPARLRLLFAWRLPAELDAASLQSAEEFQQELHRLIAHGKQEGSVRAGVVELWSMVWLTLVSAAVERVASREWSARHPHAAATLEAAWEAIAWRPIIAAPPGRDISAPNP